MVTYVQTFRGHHSLCCIQDGDDLVTLGLDILGQLYTRSQVVDYQLRGDGLKVRRHV